MSTDQPTRPTEIAAALKKSLAEHWRLFLAEGIVLVVLGLAAIVIPPLAGLAATIIIGWLFLIGGAVGLVATSGAHRAPGFGWSLFSAYRRIARRHRPLVEPVAGPGDADLCARCLFPDRRDPRHRPRARTPPRAQRAM